jgi:hypothetical protein
MGGTFRIDIAPADALVALEIEQAIEGQWISVELGDELWEV